MTTHLPTADSASLCFTKLMVSSERLFTDGTLLSRGMTLAEHPTITEACSAKCAMVWRLISFDDDQETVGLPGTGSRGTGE